MSKYIRYSNSIICDHLASQYIAAVLTPRVRSRLDKLRKQFPELDIAIANWSDSFSILHEDLMPIEPSADSWYKIERQIDRLKTEPTSQQKLKETWWKKPFFWKITTINAVVSTFILAFISLYQAPKTIENNSLLITNAPSYMAVMSSHAKTESTDKAIDFVVNVYQKTLTSPNRIFIQWSKQEPRTINEKMHLWAKNRNTGEIQYIGLEPTQENSWELDKVKWKAISESSELLFTTNINSPSPTNTIFSGPCIQLSNWNQNNA